jgi:hypothetical protein
MHVVIPMEDGGARSFWPTREVRELKAGHGAETTWAELFPEGRFIFYEGDDPTGFADEIWERFNFAVDQSPKWKGGGDPGFHCPAQLLDEIYGSGRYPMGS